MIKRYHGNRQMFEFDQGQFVAYDDHVAELQLAVDLAGQIADLNAWIAAHNVELIKANERTARMLERAQRAERQVINAARALGYVDDGA